jgi:heme-degrading monooxygenase HmoA
MANQKMDDVNKSYAVIFTATMRSPAPGYAETADRMRELAAAQPGYIGIESVMENGREITVSYWRSLEDIRAWKQHPEHLRAQQRGRSEWYADYQVRVVRIEREYGHPRGAVPPA